MPAIPSSNSATNTTNKLNQSAGIASVSVALLLVALKLWALWQTGAVSIGASLADSAMDALISIAGLWSIFYAARPADEDHAFGHASAEDLVSLGQAVFVSASGLLIGYAGFERLLRPEPHQLNAEGLGISVMVISAVITAGLVAWQSRVAARTGNKVVSADRLHYIGDLLPTIGAIFALWAAQALNWPRADAVVALFAAAIMLWGARKIGIESWHALMDRVADPEIVAELHKTVAACPGVRAYHDLKTRTSGTKLFVQVHIELDGAQRLTEAHAIAAELKRRILSDYPDSDVIIHMDVWHEAEHGSEHGAV